MSHTLDSITPDSHPLFRYILTRNGHNVALYGGKDQCLADLRDRAARFPADDWGIVDRSGGRGMSIMYSGDETWNAVADEALRYAADKINGERPHGEDAQPGGGVANPKGDQKEPKP